MDELEALRRKRLAELQAQAEAEQAQKEQLAQAQAQIKALLTQLLTPEARERLARIKMARPEYATQVELLLIQLAQAGQIKGKITDEQLKALLARIARPKKDFKIKRI
ncbi:MAG: DNA-binding protein [Methanobacteriota archaeon]|nr:MAG: DNA-binding protein [Euryarchaeota archaeon]